MAANSYTAEVEPGKLSKDGKPSIGPVYRSALATDGFPALDPRIEDPWNVFCAAAEKFRNNPMLGYREIVDGKPGEYKWMSYEEVHNRTLELGIAIRSCGIKEGGRCGIYGANSPKWIMSMQACNAHGIVFVPLFDTLGAEAVQPIICDAEVALAFVEEKNIPELLRTLPATKSYLRTIASFGKVTSQQKEEAIKFRVALFSWDEFLSLNKHFDLPVRKETDICSIVYTSGTTGDPKGVMISNKGIVTSIAGLKHTLESFNKPLTEQDVYLLSFPLAHISGRVSVEVLISSGASIGFWRGVVASLVEDIAELKPTILHAAPWELCLIYSGLQQVIASGGFFQRAMFNVAYPLMLYSMRKGHKHGEGGGLFDKIVFNKVKQGLGGNLRLIICEGAPLPFNVAKFLSVVLRSHILQAYGLTETCGSIFLSTPDKLKMLGTVGSLVPNVDVCLKSVPGMGYDALSSTPCGEVCIRGGTLFLAYHKRDDLTRKAFDDGWFQTGDIGVFQADGSLKIMGQKKNIFKHPGQGYVVPEYLECIYGADPYIDLIWVHGNDSDPCLGAVINPNKQAVEKWAKRAGIPGDFHALCNNHRLQECFLGRLKRIAKENKLKDFEFIKSVEIDPVPFDMERDLMTPTFKKKRDRLFDYYDAENSRHSHLVLLPNTANAA
ncbi:Long-chain acyl-CoA synthetases (AMP-forming) [Handroanthus impetiginosus]|uniref:Long-chain acyl-CoA synthetases (AMP-forming) n=1 Tax=Handroanthus impetiginosus TaxID=429701 RepID=A0A2G9HU12_9LAMI|nr:Long-chain acyl-CoA synthetases (AMP-forming) [Handroanthus impetiginosus]